MGDLLTGKSNSSAGRTTSLFSLWRG